ncbi:MAG: hypothetical protein JKZ03_03140, partial [Flavobacteriaceae bacterium]|nr:hypothetical protein [Flavobacteriaceae bacterium]
CNEDVNNFTLEDVHYALLDCVWLPELNGNDATEAYTFHFNVDNVLKVSNATSAGSLEGTWETIQEADGKIFVVIEFPGTDNRFNGKWEVVNFHDFHEIKLVYEDKFLELEKECDNQYTLEDLTNSLLECVWLPKFNGEESTVGYKFDFNTENQLVVTSAGNPEQTILGGWDLNFSDSGTTALLTIELPAPLENANGSWIVSGFNGEQLDLVLGQDNLLLTKDCN